MLIRERVQRQLLKTPGLTGSQIARKLNMSPGAVAGHLHHMHKLGTVERGYSAEQEAWTWQAKGEDTKAKVGRVWYVGNARYRIYMDDGCTEDRADWVSLVLRNLYPELKYARAYRESVYLPVSRNKLIKLKGE